MAFVHAELNWFNCIFWDEGFLAVNTLAASG